ncbi:MAG: acyl-CoA thioesterase [Fimbriimonas sp.]
MANSRSVSSTRTEMVQIMEPGDANFLGKVFGGRLLALIDLCAYTTASRFSGEVCVTASFDRVDFHHPIDVGDLVTTCGVVSYVGRTSVEVTIEVFAENIFTRERHHTNTARVTMVAVRDGRPVPVPRLVCETREDKVGFLQGRLRRDLRLEYREAREKRFEEIAQLSEEDLEAMMAQNQAK